MGYVISKLIFRGQKFKTKQRSPIVGKGKHFEKKFRRTDDKNDYSTIFLNSKLGQKTSSLLAARSCLVFFLLHEICLVVTFGTEISKIL